MEIDIESYRAMLAWLGERPGLPLPLHGSWAIPGEGPRYGEDGDAFHVFASSAEELDALASLFDEGEDVARTFHPQGIRRTFGWVAYEVLLDTQWRHWPWTPVDVADLRDDRLSGLDEMATWLGQSPGLPFPDAASRFGLGSPELAFRVLVGDESEFAALAGLIDQADSLARRAFRGGIAYQVVVDRQEELNRLRTRAEGVRG